MKEIFLAAVVPVLLSLFCRVVLMIRKFFISPSDCTETSHISLSGKVQPVRRARCFGRHGNGSPFGNVSLETYDYVKAVATSGRLLRPVLHDAGFAAMTLGASKLDE